MHFLNNILHKINIHSGATYLSAKLLYSHGSASKSNKQGPSIILQGVNVSGLTHLTSASFLKKNMLLRLQISCTDQVILVLFQCI